MAAREVLNWPDPRLSQRCVKVGDTDVSALVGDLLDTMYAAGGRGLAAPQIGAMVRVFVADTGWKEGASAPRVCIDPEIVAASDRTVAFTESCLSIPGISAEVTRPAEVTIRYRDAAGGIRTEILNGIDAVVVQHELDHLDGIVTFDRVDPALRAELLEIYAGSAA
ncbi:peptide deformylase [Roseivivax sediminis]|uniref:Peptide deformylase n=1 Tax=Roseivivax sediminis TaxID=936889 RepID=A0A1I2A8W7_9RHOB|nr:peptide deformylase [Roseivivax sediminis]SFE39433.1 peptide deformylase [Roseivivax sediminis]